MTSETALSGFEKSILLFAIATKTTGCFNPTWLTRLTIQFCTNIFLIVIKLRLLGFFTWVYACYYTHYSNME